MTTGWVFSLVPPRKILSMELVPPNREKWLSSQKLAKILTKRVKVQVRAGQTLISLALSQENVKVWQTLTWTFTFLVGIFAILGEISSFSLLGGTSSMLRTFLGGTSEKTHTTMYSGPKLTFQCIAGVAEGVARTTVLVRTVNGDVRWISNFKISLFWFLIKPFHFHLSR